MLGAESVIIDMAKHSSTYGYKSIVGAIKDIADPEPEFLNAAKEYGIHSALFESRGKFDIKCSGRINKFVVENGVDILHCHGYKENFYGILSHCNIPKVATNHLWKVGGPKSRIYCAIDALLIRYFDQVIGVSSEIVSLMTKLRIKNAVKILNGVDTTKFFPAEKDKALLKLYDVTGEDVILGMVSSLTSEKNHSIVLDVLATMEHPNLKLLIAGEGKLQEELQQKVNGYHLQGRVQFLGAQKQVNNLLSIVDIFLLPSLAEGLPIALLEAMACGKAVIASRVGEIGNVIRQNENGLLVDPADKLSLMNCIDELSGSKERITALGRAARDTVVNEFSSSAMSRNYCSVYDRLLA